MIKKIEQLFCRHDYADEYMANGYQIRNGTEFLPYLRTCKKCGKRVLVIMKKEREGNG